MPVTDCTTGGKPGKKWGDAGHCYPCASDGDCVAATESAKAQGRAAEAKSGVTQTFTYEYELPPDRWIR